MSEKLQKVLARAGLGSRREIERWIDEGRVQINGMTAKLGDRVELNVKIKIDGKPVYLQTTQHARTRVLMYHKPVGEVCSRSDPEGRPTVFDRLPRLQGERWIAIGRLDLNTSGLLLFTNDGELAHRLLHPSYEIDREYAVRVLGEVDRGMLNRLQQGVELEDGMASFTSIVDAGGEGVNHWYHVILNEGRNREARRLWESQGVTVSRLMRIRFGTISLPRSLRVGKCADLERAEVQNLAQLVNLEL